MANKPMTIERLEAMMEAWDQAAMALDLWEFGGAESAEDAKLHAECAAEVAKKIRTIAQSFYNREMDRIESAK